MSKILFLTPYPYNQAPSQRFRFEQYFDDLKKNGIEYEQHSFLNFDTWKLFYHKGHILSKIIGVLKGIIKRHLLIFSLNKYNIIFIHREACFIGPPYFEWLYSRVFKKKIVFDFDDAIWLKDVSAANKYLSWLKSPNKTSKIIGYANLVIAGNDYLKNYASAYNPKVVVIPTTIDTNYHKIKRIKESPNKIVIGWTGTSTTNKHFLSILHILTKIKLKYDNQVSFLTISNISIDDYNLGLNFLLWKKESEIEDLNKIDIGIMPLPDDEWAKGKCGFKGLQYMALEIPTIMSPVGVNKEIINDGENGFLASTEDEWVQKLSLLIESAELRKKVGKAGRKTVEEHYSVNAIKNRYLTLFNQVIQDQS